MTRSAVCALLAALSLAAPAAADIYWANEAADTVARADEGGAVVDADLIEGAEAPQGPRAVALDGTYVYWAHDGVPGDAPVGNIGRAELDGDSPDSDFIATSGPPQGLSIDNLRVYWTHPVQFPMQPGTGSVGRAARSGTFPTQTFVPTGPAPCAVVSNADDVYWANGGTPGSIGSSHGVFTPIQNFITSTSNPCGVAQSEGRIYWTNRAGNTIGVANQDGSGQVQGFIATGASSNPCGVAVAGGHIYWTNRGDDTIGRADLDGGNQVDDFIDDPAVNDPCGIAVTPTAQANPASHAFAETAVGAQSELRSFHIANTSSSVLDYTGVALNGPGADQFQITGNSCIANPAPPGLGCIVNVGFAPSAPGDHDAVLRVTSAASNSPTEVTISGRAVPPPENPPAEPKRHSRRVSIDANSRRFRGVLASGEPECADGQRVALRERKRGPDPRVDFDRTDDAGRWRIGERDADGRFYAVVRETELADGALCLAAKSKTIRVAAG